METGYAGWRANRTEKGKKCTNKKVSINVKRSVLSVDIKVD